MCCVLVCIALTVSSDGKVPIAMSKRILYSAFKAIAHINATKSEFQLISISCSKKTRSLSPACNKKHTPQPQIWRKITLKLQQKTVRNTHKYCSKSSPLIFNYHADVEQLNKASCGVGYCNFPFMQKFASKKTYVIVYGLTGSFYLALSTYFVGTISTLEKRFQIPSFYIGKMSIIIKKRAKYHINKNVLIF